MAVVACVSVFLCVTLLVWAAISDCMQRVIPNTANALIVCAFFFYAGSTGMPANQILAHSLCATIILACGFILFEYSILGAGDAKLFASVALWTGFDHVFIFLTMTALIGGGLAVIYLVKSSVDLNKGDAIQKKVMLPYGTAISLAALLILPRVVQPLDPALVGWCSNLF